MIEKVAQDIDEQLNIAKEKLESKQKENVNNFNMEIEKCKKQIRNLKEQIKGKKNWFNGLHWTVKPWKLAELGVFVATKGLAIAGLYAAIGVLEGLKLAALGILEIAKATIDVASVINTTLADLANKVISFSFSGKKILTIDKATFTTNLNSVCGGSTKIVLKGTFLGKPFGKPPSNELTINFNFLEPRVGGKSLADSLTAVPENPPDDTKPPLPPSGLTIS